MMSRPFKGNPLIVGPVMLLAGIGMASEGPTSRSPVFSEVSIAAGIDFVHQNSPTSEKYLVETMGGGCAFLDYNRDGLLDIYLVNGDELQIGMKPDHEVRKTARAYQNFLYRNNGDGTFTDVTTRAGVEGKGYGMGVAVADVDNDGWPDMYVTNYGPNIFYRNRGDGTFEDITKDAGVRAGGWSAGAGFFDYDRDGRLDLYVTRYLDWTFENNRFCGQPHPGRMYCHPDLYSGVPDLLFRNAGGTRFEDVSREAGIDSPLGKGLGVAFADYDQDGWLDIFVANDSVRCFLYRNNRNGMFSEVALIAGAAVKESGQTFAGMGVDFNDYDNDGLPDIFVTALNGERYVLFRNLDGGHFQDVTQSSGIGKHTYDYSGWGTRWVDFDNDGWKDLFVANSHVVDNVELYYSHIRYLQKPLLLKNRSGLFSDRSSWLGTVAESVWAGRGAAFGDYDNDGDIDILVSNCGQKAYLLRNDSSNAANWLTLDLVGSRSNRDGLGARVEVTLRDGSRLYSQATTAGSYLSASDRRVHFGLGKEQVRQIEILWPNGVTQTLKQVQTRKVVRVIEPSGSK